MNSMHQQICSLGSSLYSYAPSNNHFINDSQICPNVTKPLNNSSPKIHPNATSKKPSKETQISNSDNNPSRRKFTEEEDKYLTQLVDEMGPKNWESIAKKMPNRTARQCRDRYSNYLVPGFFNGEWSAEEDENLYKKYQEIGPRWTIIHQFFKNRSPNSLKNRWNYFVSRSDFKLHLKQNSGTNSNAYNMATMQQPTNQHFINFNNQMKMPQTYEAPLYQPKMQYYGCYNQFPVNITQNVNYPVNIGYNHIKMQKMQNNIGINMHRNRNKLYNKPHQKNVNVSKEIKIEDQKFKQKLSNFTDIEEPSESIFSLHLDQKNPGMFDEEAEEFDNNMYTFDDPELFNF